MTKLILNLINFLILEQEFIYTSYIFVHTDYILEFSEYLYIIQFYQYRINRKSFLYSPYTDFNR